MAQALRRVSADGFRSLGHVDVDFGPLSVLVGPNGSGKSNLLQVLAFVRDTARFNTAQAVALRGGFTHILRQDGETERVRLTIEAVVSEFASKSATDKYTLELAEDDHGDIDREEELLYKTVRGAGRRQKIQASGSEVAIGDTKQIRDRGYLTLSSDDVSALGTVARLNSEELGSGPSAFFDFLSSVRYLDPNVDLARAPSRVSQTSLDDDASNLASALRALHESHPDDFVSLERDLAKCLPGLVEIQFGIVGGSSTSVVVRLVERGVIEPIDLADASFGTVRLLALLTALHDPEPPRLTIIEEIDHGLHPYALDVLVDRMRAASTRTQIIVASHSPTLVNRLQADEIIICDRDPETGESMIPAIEPETLAAVLEGSDWKAGELWFSGAIDGVPR